MTQAQQLITDADLIVDPDRWTETTNSGFATNCPIPTDSDTYADTWTAVPDQLLPVLQQLLSGVTDDVASHRLNVSSRTFSRRVAELLDLLGVQTRFQLGFELARQSRTRSAPRPPVRRLVAVGPVG